MARMAQPSSASPTASAEAMTLERAQIALQCALQPIVDVRTGVVHGVEALMRGYERLGYAGPLEVIERFAREGDLVGFEGLMHRKAIAAFLASPLARRSEAGRLFVNLDARAVPAGDMTELSQALDLMRGEGLSAANLCIELSATPPGGAAARLENWIVDFRAAGLRFAADHFGHGGAELKLVHDNLVDYIKVDRYFVSRLESQTRKRVFLANLCRLAHVLGVRVAAQGVETAAEFVACRDLGCDLVQGYHVSRPLPPDALLAWLQGVSQAAT